MKPPAARSRIGRFNTDLNNATGLGFTASFATLGTPTGRTEVNAVVGVGAFTGKDCVPDAGQMLPSRARTGRDHPLIW